MHKYSDFFQTLHDERSPTGYLGRGTHYSVLRAVVFHDAAGKPLPKGHFADFAVVWDEDHDDRVIEPIEMIYQSGLLPLFVIFGERKGEFTAVLANGVEDPELASVLQKRVSLITQQLGDAWLGHVVGLEDEENSIIGASREKVMLYLKNIAMLWQLGLKETPIGNKLPVSVLFRKLDCLEISVRTENCCKNNSLVYIGDLVQMTEAEMLRLPNFGRKSLNELKEILAQMGLYFGMKVPGWLTTTEQVAKNSPPPVEIATTVRPY